MFFPLSCWKVEEQGSRDCGGKRRGRREREEKTLDVRGKDEDVEKMKRRKSPFSRLPVPLSSLRYSKVMPTLVSPFFFL